MKNNFLPVLLVEGEKCVESAKDLIKEEYFVSTWAGGTGGVEKTDFSPLKDYTIILWPDNDTPGKNAMQKIAQKLLEIECKKIFNIKVENKPEKWDIADAIKENENISRYIEENKKLYQESLIYPVLTYEDLKNTPLYLT